MSKIIPWLTIIGIGEDGLNGLSDASQKALQDAKFVFGAPRHLELANIDERGIEFPIPFSIEPILKKRSEAIVLLTSGDPFWYGAGTSITRHLEMGEWTAFPAQSTFSLAAACLAWPLENTHCVGLHAEPFNRILPTLNDQSRWIVLLRDGEGVRDFCKWLDAHGFGNSDIHVLEALGGPRERVRKITARSFDFSDVTHPVAVGLSVCGEGMSQTSGLVDHHFTTDGQMTKQPIRAMALAALEPKEGELLWDLGAGSGTIATEWLLAAHRTRAIAVERRADRVSNIQSNFEKFGLENRMEIVIGESADMIETLENPNAIFIGGGATAPLIEMSLSKLLECGRLVVHAVTAESEVLLFEMKKQYGGNLQRIEISNLESLGSMQAWKASYPLTSWVLRK